MPKGKKKSVNLNVPYSVSKKSSGDQEARQKRCFTL